MQDRNRLNELVKIYNDKAQSYDEDSLANEWGYTYLKNVRRSKSARQNEGEKNSGIPE